MSDTFAAFAVSVSELLCIQFLTHFFFLSFSNDDKLFFLSFRLEKLGKLSPLMIVKPNSIQF